MVDRSDLYCDTCPNRFADRGGQAVTDEYARAAGWHIYRGPSIVDSLVKLTKALCPECMGTSRTRGEKIMNLQGQLDLADVFFFVVDQAPKPKPQPKGKRRKEGIN